MRFARLAAAAAIVLALAAPAPAQPYPAGNITFLVPYAAGGSADIVARLIGIKLQDALGRTVVVENRPGGSEMLVSEAIARSSPDGLTIGIISNALAINETLVPNRRYELGQLTAVARVIEIPFAIMVHPSVPASSLPELVALAKASPGRLNYGHLGPGSPHFFTMEWLKRTAGIDIVAVPYRGAAPAYAALVTGDVQVIASGLGAATPFLEAKQAKALAALSPRRPPSMPDLPTIAEAGYPNFNLRSWMGIFVRAGTPTDVSRRLEAAVLRAMDEPEVKERLMRLGLDPAPLPGRDFASYIAEEVVNWRNIVKATGSKLE